MSLLAGSQATSPADPTTKVARRRPDPTVVVLVVAAVLSVAVAVLYLSGAVLRASLHEVIHDARVQAAAVSFTDTASARVLRADADRFEGDVPMAGRSALTEDLRALRHDMALVRTGDTTPASLHPMLTAGR